MFDIYLKSIEIDKVRNLSNINIPISDEKKRNLIITGKNGSGKTSLLNAIGSNLDYLVTKGDYSSYRKNISVYEKMINIGGTENEIAEWKKELDRCKKKLVDAKAGVKIAFNIADNSLKSYFDNNDFIAAYYGATRCFSTIIPKHIAKIDLKDQYSMREQPRNEFVMYITDLKMKEALARTSGNDSMADSIHTWFIKFDDLLKTIFEDDTTALSFDPESFEFTITQEGKNPFGFNVLSDGYAAVLDIVVDIMLRMEKHNNRSFIFDMPGIVLIDEIETHLHIELQRNIMKMLTTLFPNIQFIVTTHSPFILSNTENAVIYDLENRTLVKDGLENVPYSGIVEGYFGADSLSKKLRNKFDRYKELVKKETITDSDISEIVGLENYLEEIPDYLALDISAEYHRLKLQFQSRGDL